MKSGGPKLRRGVRDNRRVPTSFPSITALDGLIADLGVGDARRRQLGMVRGELDRALAKGALPIGARRSLRRLLEREALEPYVRIAESGALRARRVGDGYPPTSEATNSIRLQVVDLLREVLGLPVLQLAGGAPVLRPTPASDRLAALRRQLGAAPANSRQPASSWSPRSARR